MEGNSLIIGTIPSLPWADGGSVRMTIDPANIELSTSQIQVRNVTVWVSVLTDFILKIQVLVNTVACFVSEDAIRIVNWFI
jgi:hypothetical protein